MKLRKPIFSDDLNDIGTDTLNNDFFQSNIGYTVYHALFRQPNQAGHATGLSVAAVREESVAL